MLRPRSEPLRRQREIQDLTPWAVGLTCAAVAWLALVLTAPVAMSRGSLPVVTLAVYHAGSLVCHQRPERSFHLAGVQLPVCARCFGLYLAGASGLSVAWRSRRRFCAGAVRALLALAALPIVTTVALEWLGAIETSNLQRMLTGLPLGFAAGVVIVRSLSRSGDAL
jgi:uncharacterized membrane protein